MRIGKSVSGVVKSKSSSIGIHNAITKNKTVASVTFNSHIDATIWDSICFPIRRETLKAL
jgi:hypothetical protein